MDLSGQVGVVIGAANGIGAAVSAELRAGGANVVGVDLVAAPDVIIGDGSNPSVLDTALKHATTLPGRLSMLVYAAAYTHDSAPVPELSDDQWQRSFDVTVTGAWQAATRFAERATAPAAIVTIASIQAYAAHPGQAGYGSAKAALLGLTRSLAVDLGPRGIRCNAVVPGIVRVERNRNQWDEPARVAARTRRIPVGRLGQPRDVATVVAFLLSDDAAFVSGACLPVDGGELALGAEYPEQS